MHQHRTHYEPRHPSELRDEPSTAARDIAVCVAALAAFGFAYIGLVAAMAFF